MQNFFHGPLHFPSPRPAYPIFSRLSPTLHDTEPGESARPVQQSFLKNTYLMVGQCCADIRVLRLLTLSTPSVHGPNFLSGNLLLFGYQAKHHSPLDRIVECIGTCGARTHCPCSCCASGRKAHRHLAGEHRNRRPLAAPTLK